MDLRGWTDFHEAVQREKLVDRVGWRLFHVWRACTGAKQRATENRDGQKSVILARLSMILVNMILSSTQERKFSATMVVEGERSNNHRLVVRKVATVILLQPNLTST